MPHRDGCDRLGSFPESDLTVISPFRQQLLRGPINGSLGMTASAFYSSEYGFRILYLVLHNKVTAS